MENSERLGRQARSKIEPDTILLQVLSAELLRLWWGNWQIEQVIPAKVTFFIY